MGCDPAQRRAATPGYEIRNAASIAAMILTTEALITDLPEKDKAPAMPGGGGMDY